MEYWTLQEVDLAVHWKVHGVSTIQHNRPEFKPEHEIEDLITGEIVKSFSPYKRLARQALQIPFALVASTTLGFLITICFGIEIFISEVYDGPFKSILVRQIRNYLLRHLLNLVRFIFLLHSLPPSSPA